MSNKVEFVAGAGINITADASNKKITIASSGGGNSLTSDQLAALSNSEANGTNKFVTEKDAIRVIEIFTKPTIIDRSGPFTVPLTGKYRLRLCGGGASGGNGFGYSITNNSVVKCGSGGNSGYLRTEELILQKDTVLNIVIGAGGVVTNDGINSHGNHGGKTTVTIDSNIYEAKGGEIYTDTLTISNFQGILKPTAPNPLYDGSQGASQGGAGYINVYSAGTNPPTSTTPSQNGGNGASMGGVAGNSAGGGGGGGVIAGFILAEVGTATSAAQGYGAGGGGAAIIYSSYGTPSYTHVSASGAQGAVSLEYLGPN